MAAKKKRTCEKPTKQRARSKDDAETVLAWLERGTKKIRDGMARFAIPSDRAFGVPPGGPFRERQ